MSAFLMCIYTIILGVLLGWLCLIFACAIAGGLIALISYILDKRLER